MTKAKCFHRLLQFSLIIFSITIASEITAEEIELTMPPTDETVEVYSDIYRSSVLRGIRFDREIDPAESMKEEIFLESKLSAIARENSAIMENKSLLADVDFYQSKFVLDYYINEHLTYPNISDEQIQRYYDENLESFIQEEKVAFQHIFLLVPNGEETIESEKRELADRLIRQLKRGKDFESLVQEYSELDGAGESDGAVGPVETERLSSEIQEAIKSLEPGEISGPVRTKYGWEIIKLNEVIQANAVSLEIAGPMIKESLARTKVQSMQSSLVEEVKNSFPAKINENIYELEKPHDSDEPLVTINDQVTLTFDQVLFKVGATHAYNNVAGDIEKVKAGIDRIITTEQIKLKAEAEGLLQKAVVRQALQLIENRLLAERYLKTLPDPEPVTENEAKAYFEEYRREFRTFVEYKGKRYSWNISSDLENRSTIAYLKRLKKDEVAELIDRVESGSMTREELASQANSVVDIAWTREGVGGYLQDVAFLNTDKGEFTDIWEEMDRISVGYAEDIKKPELLTFEEAKERVYSLAKMSKDKKYREQMVEEILQDYAKLGL